MTELQRHRGRKPGHLPTTAKQQEVLRLRGERLKFREIGGRLGITAGAPWEAYRRANRQA